MIQTAEEVLTLSPVMPVVVVEDADTAERLAHALLAGGIRTIVVTLRTPAALDAIRRALDRGRALSSSCSPR